MMTSSKEGARPPGRRVLRSYHFLSGAQDPHLPKADVERGTLQAPVGLADDDDVDTPGQGGRVQALVELLHGHKHLARQLPDVIHGLSLENRHTNRHTKNSSGGGHLPGDHQNERLASNTRVSRPV